MADIKQRIPEETQEGIDYLDEWGLPHYGRKFISSSVVETVDLLCEGEIDGLVQGEYTYVGTAGNIGYTSATFTSFRGDYAWLRSIYWNEVPVVREDGKYNFQSIQAGFRLGSPGEFVQNPINTSSYYFNDYRLSVSRNIGEKIRGNVGSTDHSKIYRILNRQCSAVEIFIKIAALGESIVQGDEIGDVVDSTLYFTYHYKPVFINKADPQSYLRFAGTSKIIGKVNYGLLISRRIEFEISYLTDKNFVGWEVMITKHTPDSATGRVRNITFIDTIKEYYAYAFMYPKCATVRSLFSSQFFSQLPSRAYDVKLLKVKVPDTYDPILRTYTEPLGYWDGTFSTTKQWSNNPVWCFYDLLTNTRYGLGKYIPESSVDKFQLYEIAKYCDTLVSDGRGGVEPRFTCNLLLQDREEAYKVLQDMASIFQALIYYSNGTIFAVQDSPKTPIVQFTNANVEDGDFQYSSSAKKSRHTIALVRYNDPYNMFRPAIEYVEDIEGIKRYGIRQTEVTAFGCASQGQANRLGRWILSSEALETETINFVAGTEGSYLKPGDVFMVYDRNRKSTRNAGRISKYEVNVTGSKVVLDNQISLDSTLEYNFTLLTPSYNYVPQDISDFNSNSSTGIRREFLQKKQFLGSSSFVESGKTHIQFDSVFDSTNYHVGNHQVWTLEFPDGSYTYENTNKLVDSNYDYYRALTIKELDIHRYQIVGLQYSPHKYLEIESGLQFQRPRDKVQIVPAAPDSISLELEQYYTTQTINFTVNVSNFSGATDYRVYAKKDLYIDNATPSGDYLIATLPSSRLSDNFYPDETGRFYFRAYGYNEDNRLHSNTYVSGDIYVLGDNNPVKDITVSNLNIFEFTGDYQTGYQREARISILNPTFSWQAGFQNEGSVPEETLYRVTIRKPSPDSIPSDTIYYEKTGITPIDNNLRWQFPFTLNNSTDLRALGGPFRNYDVVVEAADVSGYTSAGNLINPRIENGWWNNREGYDIINVYNPPISGIDISSGETHPAGYQTTNLRGADRSATIIITGSTVPDDCVGGYIYTSPYPFSGLDARTGKAFIFRKEFTWDHQGKYAYAPNAFAQVGRVMTGFVAVGFYDTFDAAHKDTVTNPWSGIYVSNSAPCVATSDIGEANILGTSDSLGTIKKVTDENGTERTALVYANGRVFYL